ncbi:MAG: LPS export ABC transporter permease LptF [Marinobacterium sp.]|nr:LPS export ABC transporter permease LptF [Marinobacterium sp.]
MIIFRYISREILFNMLAVSSVLLVIIMSGRFVKYLAKAAAGELSPELVLQIMMLRLPGFLELILPLGLFLGILLGYGRLYLESEMAVLYASGMSQRRLIVYAMGPALLVAAMVASFSLYLTPMGTLKMSQLLEQAAARSQIETITPGRFQRFDNGAVSYVEGVNDGLLERVFFAQPVDHDGRVAVVLADGGQRLVQADGGRFLVLDDGVRYEGAPGWADYTRTRYDQYGVRLKDSDASLQTTETETRSTTELWLLEDAASVAQLQWRFTIPVLALVVTLIAVPLARVNPRQGRYARLVPSILIYLLYITLLSAARSNIEEGKAGAELIWLVHLMFLMLAVNFIMLGNFWARQFNRLPAVSLNSLRFWRSTR